MPAQQEAGIAKLYKVYLFKMFWKPILNTSTVLTTSKQSCGNFA